MSDSLKAPTTIDGSWGVSALGAHFSPWKLQAAIAAFHLTSGVVGYYVPKLLGFSEVCYVMFNFSLFSVFFFSFFINKMKSCCFRLIQGLLELKPP
jgi:hypothetical protein